LRISINNFCLKGLIYGTAGIESCVTKLFNFQVLRGFKWVYLLTGHLCSVG
jgi:hypothetical protein